MPLSEHEQRLLDEMERNLYQNESDVVSTGGRGRRAPNYTAIVSGVVLGAIGLGVMLTGVVVNMTALGVIGFLLLFIGVMAAVTIPGKPLTPGVGGGTSEAGRGSKSLMDQLNDRWDRRQGGDIR
jgi:F0F1-type ATP synthase assembly protein I